MRKVLLVSALALAVAGCAAGQGETPEVQVRDLSASRERNDTATTYKVEAGDTLYGIAWRHDMDYRELARLNGIGPPYRIQPGQRLALSADARPGQRREEAPADGSAVVATGLGEAARAGGEAEGDMAWLRPDESAIQRNRRLTARPLGEAEARGETGSEAAPAEAAPAGDATPGPGPVYSYDSPGADGSLSERDLAERRALEAQWPQGEDEGPAETADRAAPAASQEEAEDRREVAGDAASDESSVAAQREVSEPEPAPRVDAGTSVAGEPESERRTGRSYIPAEEVDWQWPADGEVIGRFGEGSSITAGIDIAGEKGQPVMAAGSGIVVYAGSGVRGYGNLVLLKHNDEYLSAYAHNDSLNVRENDVVEAGEVIATMGDSDAEDVRLHFEVRKEGQPRDPLEFLPAR